MRFAVVAGILAFSSFTQAQELAFVSFRDGSATEDGYELAKVGVTWKLVNCAGDLTLIYSLDPSTVSAASTYWFKGHRHVVPGSYSLPTVTTIRFAGQVVGKARFADSFTGAQPGGCLGQGQALGPWKVLAPEHKSDEPVQAVVQTDTAPTTLHNRDFERALEREEREREARQREEKAEAKRADDQRAAEAQRQAATADEPTAPVQGQTSSDPEQRERDARQERLAAQKRQIEAEQKAAREREQRSQAATAQAISGLSSLVDQIASDQERRKELAAAATQRQREALQDELCNGDDSFFMGRLSESSDSSYRIHPGDLCRSDRSFFWLRWKVSTRGRWRLTYAGAEVNIIIREGGETMRIRAGERFFADPGEYRVEFEGDPGLIIRPMLMNADDCWIPDAQQLSNEGAHIAASASPLCGGGPVLPDERGWFYALPTAATPEGDLLVDVRGEKVTASIYAIVDRRIASQVYGATGVDEVSLRVPAPDSGKRLFLLVTRGTGGDGPIDIKVRQSFVARFIGGLSGGFAIGHTTQALFMTKPTFESKGSPATFAGGFDTTLHLGIRFHENFATGAAASFNYTSQQLDFLFGPFLRIQAAEGMFRMKLMVGPSIGGDRYRPPDEEGGWGSPRWGWGARFDIGAYSHGDGASLSGGFVPAFFKVILASDRVTFLAGLSLSLDDL